MPFWIVDIYMDWRRRWSFFAPPSRWSPAMTLGAGGVGGHLAFTQNGLRLKVSDLPELGAWD